MPGGRVETHRDDSPFATGTHKGADNATVFNDPGKDLKSCGVAVGSLIRNTTDGSEGLITAVTEDGGTATLTGGADTLVTQDTDDFTETDIAANRIALTSSTKVTVTALDNDEDVYLLKDFGRNYFNNDFEFRLKLNCSASSNNSLVGVWGLANVQKSIKDIQDADDSALYVYWLKSGGFDFIAVGYSEGGSPLSIVMFGTISTDYWLKIIRDESVGTHGTLYLYVYSDEDMSVLVNSSSITLISKVDFQYLYWTMAYNDGTAGLSWSATIEDMAFIDYGNIWQGGDTYEIYITSEYNSKISSIWVDRSRGWKSDKRKLQGGWREEDIDLDRYDPHVWGPGFPEKRRG